MSERSGLERALGAAGLAAGGPWLATAREASGLENACVNYKFPVVAGARA